MAAFIQYHNGLERNVERHLETICDGDPGLSFAPGVTHPRFPGTWIEVSYAPTKSTAGGVIADEVVGSTRHFTDAAGNRVAVTGDVIIAPRAATETVTPFFLPAYQVLTQPGLTEWVLEQATGHWDAFVYYDADDSHPQGAGVLYVTWKNATPSKASCIPAPSNVMLLHELAHAARPLPLPQAPANAQNSERRAVVIENGFRLSVGLDARASYDVDEKSVAVGAGVC